MRGYGKACLRCRDRKQRCKEGPAGADGCAQCVKAGVACAVVSKRASQRHTAEDGGNGDGDGDGDGESNAESIYPASSGTRIATPARMAASGLPGSEGVQVDQSVAAARSSGPASAAAPAPAFWTSPRTPLASAHAPTPNHTEDALLLATYFAWQCPQLLPIDEDLFRRDLARQSGSYWSPLLHAALCAQASRHVPGAGGHYTDRATGLLAAELLRPPCVPTIQALLVLAGRKLAMGDAHAGWLFSGMAFRMLGDMEVDLEGEAGVGGEQGEVLRRLYWSAFCWDKFFALTMGRQPTLHVPDHATPPQWSSIKTWAWDGYPAQFSFEGETFHASCLLYRIVESIIERLYSRTRRDDRHHDGDFVHATHAKLIAWRQHVSPGILLDTAYLPVHSPPPHILTLNLLYRTTWILLYRPVRRGRGPDAASAHRTCVAKAKEIHLLYTLHERSFGLQNITYLVAYMAYVSATVDVGEALCADAARHEPAVGRLELTLRVLSRAVRHTPGIQRSLHHLGIKLARAREERVRGDADGEGGGMSGMVSGMASPTTAHPSGGMDGLEGEQLGAAPTGQQIAQALSYPPVPDPNQNLNLNPNPYLNLNSNLAGLDLGVGFEQLFNSLLPEFEHVPGGPGYDPLVAGLDSTAYLPMDLDLDLGWLDA